MAIFTIICKCGQENHPGSLVGFHLIDHALLCVHQGRQLRQQHPTDGRQITLPLQHAGEAGQVGLEPILLRVAVGREPQVVDHRVDVVFQVCEFAAGFYLDRSRQIALGHGRRDLCDRAHLVRQVIGEQVHVTG